MRIWTGNTRAPWHDYTRRQIYHLTLMKHPDVAPFGHLAGDWQIPRGKPGRSYIQASAIGHAVKESLRDIRTIHPALKVLQYALMPDHLHILLSVESVLDEILGRKIAAFKVMVNKRADLETVFARGFNDQILTATRNLDTIFKYLRDNPYRLAIRVARPEYFSRINRITVGEESYSTYGNFQLLTNPFRDQVVVHRADGAARKRSDRDKWIHIGANGAFLSRRSFPLPRKRSEPQRKLTVPRSS